MLSLLHTQKNLLTFISPTWGNCKHGFMRLYGNNKSVVLYNTYSKSSGSFTGNKARALVTHLTVYIQSAVVIIMSYMTGLPLDLFH